MKAAVLLSTTSSREEAQKIAHALVEQELVACVNIVGPIESIYRWQASIETAQEFLLIMKTRADVFADIEAALRELHSYEVPELVQLPVENGLPEYLAWISESVK